MIGLRCVIASLLACCVVPAATVFAGDHADAPLTAQDRGSDLGDAYFFLAPNNNVFAVLAMTVHGFITPSQNSKEGVFATDRRFVFRIENTGDARVDATYRVAFGRQTGPHKAQTATVTLPNGQSFTGVTTVSRSAFGQPADDPVVTTDPESNVSVFAGLIDEPFFFDEAAAESYFVSRRAKTTNPGILTRGRDSYAGHNTLVILLAVPAASLRGTAGNVVGLSCASQALVQTPDAKWVTRDRVGIPLINQLLIGYGRGDAYNAASTSDDAAGVFAGSFVQSLKDLQTDATSIAILKELAVTHGDFLRLDTSIPNTGPEGGTNAPAAFPNGRRPNDDVVDTMLTLVNNREAQGDAVPDNERVFRNFVPFFAFPHQPFAPGEDDLTRH